MSQNYLYDKKIKHKEFFLFIFRPWYEAFVVILLHGDVSSQKIVKNLIKKLLESEDVDNLQLMTSIVDELDKAVRKVKVINNSFYNGLKLYH